MNMEIDKLNIEAQNKENGESKFPAMNDLKNEGTGLKDIKEDAEKMNSVPEEEKYENMAAPEIINEPNADIPAVVVTGDPYGTGKNLDHSQGDNPYHAKGNCGLVSVTNLLKMSGMDVTEDDVTKYALDNKLCSDPLFGRDGSRGGTVAEQRLEVLKHFGVEAKSFDGLSTDKIAEAVESGRGVLMAVNAGYLWNEPAYVKDAMGGVRTNHCITITATARDPVTGKVDGFYICDSGRGETNDASRFVSINDINKCYTNMPGASVQITDNPIR